MKYEELDGPAKQRALDTVRESNDLETMLDGAVETVREMEDMLGIEISLWGLQKQAPIWTFDPHYQSSCGFEFYWRPLERRQLTNNFCRLLDEFPTWVELHEAALAVAELSLKYDPEDWYIACRVAAPDGRSYFSKSVTIRPNDDLMDRMWNENIITDEGIEDDWGFGFDSMMQFALWRERQLERGVPLHGSDTEIETDIEDALGALQTVFAKFMQAEYEYHDSDEAIIESIEANGWEFTEEGRWA
jgi:hypothetical protein